MVLHAPTRKSVALFGAVNLRGGQMIAHFNPLFEAQSFLAFLKGLLRRRSHGKKMMVITDNAATTMPPRWPAGWGNTATSWSCYSYRPIARTSIRLSACGSCCEGCAPTTNTSQNWNSYKTRSRSSSRNGGDPIKSSGAYAALLKTLCIEVSAIYRLPKPSKATLPA